MTGLPRLVVIGGLAMTGAVSLGLGRFGYTLLLPAMRDALGWSYAQAGTMNTANALGYLLGAVLSAPLIAKIPARRLCVAGLVLVTGSLLACAATGRFEVLLVLRALAGAAGALAFVCGATIAVDFAVRRGLSTTVALGGYTAGTGVGIVLSTVVVPVVGAGPGGDWHGGWLVLGLLGVAGTVVVWFAAGACRAAPAGAARSDKVDHVAASPRRDAAVWSTLRGNPTRPGLVPSLVAFALFGAGYISYMTFVVALVRERSPGDPHTVLFWTLLGTASVATTPLWLRPLDRLPGGRGLALALGAVLAGVVVLLAGARAGPGGPGAAYLSAALFGGSFLAVITGAAAVARRVVDPADWVPAIGALTTVFAVGQIAGPVLAGWLADVAGGLRSGLVLAAALLAAATAAALLQRDRP